MKMDSQLQILPSCHGNSSKSKKSSALTSDSHFIELPELLVHSLSRHVVSEADGAERNEAEVEGLEEVPVFLQGREDGGRDEEEARDGQGGEHSGMNDGHQWLGQAPACVDVHDRSPGAKYHDPLHHGSEEEKGEGNANH